MGADIHVFAEIKTTDGSYVAIADGEFSMSRDYRLFGALGGVRTTNDIAPLFAPRGLPADVSQEVSEHFFMPVINDEQAAKWHIGPHATPDQAKRMVADGVSSWLAAGSTTPRTPSTGGYISFPDWHSASWLTLSEISTALDHAKYPESKTPREFRLLLQYLRIYAAETNGIARLVFWFDN